MTRLELEQLVAQYMHRTDLEPVIPGFVDLATARLARDLRSMWNETLVEVDIQDDPYQLPDDWRAFRSVAQIADGGPWPLRYVGSHEIGRYKSSGGAAQVYSVVGGRQLQVRPYQAGNYILDYYNAPADLSGDGSTNDVLDNYPYLYLYASLIEGLIYVQDESMASNMISVYNGELQAANNESVSSRTGDAPAMRAV